MRRLSVSRHLTRRTISLPSMDEAGPVAVAPIVDAYVRRANGTIDDKALAFTVDLQDDDTMQAPRGAVEIIVRNLIDNAITYTPERGSVHVSGEQDGEDRREAVHSACLSSSR